MNPKAIQRLRKNLAKQDFDHEANESIVKDFIRKAKKGIL